MTRDRSRGKTRNIWTTTRMGQSIPISSKFQNENVFVYYFTLHNFYRHGPDNVKNISDNTLVDGTHLVNVYKDYLLIVSIVTRV